MNDVTNDQGSKLAVMIYQMNYEVILKNAGSLFEGIRNLFASKRPLQPSASDTPDTDLSTFSEDPSGTED